MHSKLNLRPRELLRFCLYAVLSIFLVSIMLSAANALSVSPTSVQKGSSVSAYEDYSFSSSCTQSRICIDGSCSQWGGGGFHSKSMTIYPTSSRYINAKSECYEKQWYCAYLCSAWSTKENSDVWVNVYCSSGYTGNYRCGYWYEGSDNIYREYLNSNCGYTWNWWADCNSLNGYYCSGSYRQYRDYGCSGGSCSTYNTGTNTYCYNGCSGGNCNSGQTSQYRCTTFGDVSQRAYQYSDGSLSWSDYQYCNGLDSWVCYDAETRAERDGYCNGGTGKCSSNLKNFKNCNDYNYVDSTPVKYCKPVSSHWEVWQHQLYHDYGCSSGSCTQSTTYWTNEQGLMTCMAGCSNGACESQTFDITNVVPGSGTYNLSNTLPVTIYYTSNFNGQVAIAVDLIRGVAPNCYKLHCGQASSDTECNLGCQTSSLKYLTVSPGSSSQTVYITLPSTSLIDGDDDIFSVKVGAWRTPFTDPYELYTDGTKTVTCHVGQNGNQNYLSISCKGELEEGDCDANYECKSGLVCVPGAGSKYGWGSGVDVCEMDCSSENRCASATELHKYASYDPSANNCKYSVYYKPSDSWMCTTDSTTKFYRRYQDCNSGSLSFPSYDEPSTFYNCGNDDRTTSADYCLGDNLMRQINTTRHGCSGGSCIQNRIESSDNLLLNCNTLDGWRCSGNVREHVNGYCSSSVKDCATAIDYTETCQFGCDATTATCNSLDITGGTADSSVKLGSQLGITANVNSYGIDDDVIFVVDVVRDISGSCQKLWCADPANDNECGTGGCLDGGVHAPVSIVSGYTNKVELDVLLPFNGATGVYGVVVAAYKPSASDPTKPDYSKQYDSQHIATVDVRSACDGVICADKCVGDSLYNNGVCDPSTGGCDYTSTDCSASLTACDGDNLTYMAGYCSSSTLSCELSYASSIFCTNGCTTDGANSYCNSGSVGFVPKPGDSGQSGSSGSSSDVLLAALIAAGVAAAGSLAVLYSRPSGKSELNISLSNIYKSLTKLKSVGISEAPPRPTLTGILSNVRTNLGNALAIVSQRAPDYGGKPPAPPEKGPWLEPSYAVPTANTDGIFAGYGHAIPQSYLEGLRLQQEEKAREVQQFSQLLAGMTPADLAKLSESDREWLFANSTRYGFDNAAALFGSRDSLNAYLGVLFPRPPEPPTDISNKPWWEKIAQGWSMSLGETWNGITSFFGSVADGSALTGLGEWAWNGLTGYANDFANDSLGTLWNTYKAPYEIAWGLAGAYVNALITDPIGTIAKTAMVVGGVLIIAAGAIATATGIGAIAGIPLIAIGAGLVGAGLATIAIQNSWDYATSQTEEELQEKAKGNAEDNLWIAFGLVDLAAAGLAIKAAGTTIKIVGTTGTGEKIIGTGSKITYVDEVTGATKTVQLTRDMPATELAALVLRLQKLHKLKHALGLSDEAIELIAKNLVGFDDVVDLIVKYKNTKGIERILNDIKNAGNTGNVRGAASHLKRAEKLELGGYQIKEFEHPIGDGTTRSIDIVAEINGKTVWVENKASLQFKSLDELERFKNQLDAYKIRAPSEGVSEIIITSDVAADASYARVLKDAGFTEVLMPDGSMRWVYKLSDGMTLRITDA